MRRALLCLWMLAVFSGCATTGVQRLDLRDSRLPVEARRWLADAEDEVAIAKARLEEAGAEFDKLERYHKDLTVRLQAIQAVPVEGAATADTFLAFTEQRIALKKHQRQSASDNLDLARARLTLARAETAVRYDLAVYELEPLVQDVAQRRSLVAAAEQQVELQRALVEQAADEFWERYRQYVSKGGVTHSIWQAR